MHAHRESAYHARGHAHLQLYHSAKTLNVTSENGAFSTVAVTVGNKAITIAIQPIYGINPSVDVKQTTQ